MQRTASARGTLPGHNSSAALAAGAAAGLIGGLVASWFMVKFQHRVWPPPKGDGGEASTTKLARHLIELSGNGPLTDEQTKAAGEFVHYALGAGLGLGYGAAAISRPVVTRGAGLSFGIATELVLDQALVPALGLSNPFWKCPAEWSLRGLAAHLVFGVTTDVSRRLILLLIDAVSPDVA